MKEEGYEQELTELKLKIDNLKHYMKELEEKYDKKFNLMIILDCVISLLAAPLLSTGQIVFMLVYVGLIGVNTIMSVKKMIRIKEESKDINEQKKYLEDVKNEIEEIKEKKVDIKSINFQFEWKKRLKLMKIYSAYKKSFKKHYKKNDLYEVLQYSGYNNAESYYLYDKTRNEVDNKQKNKILLKFNER